MSSATNREILAQETLKGGDPFKGYAKRVTGDANKEVENIEKFPIEKKGSNK